MLKSLSNQELWLAQHEKFNDSNEFEIMFIKEDDSIMAKLVGAKWDTLYNYYNGAF